MYSISMCIAIRYKEGDLERSVGFREPQAKLPIKLKRQGYQWVTWGRRVHQAGNLPLGGCARHEHICAGLWDAYFPKPVIITAHAFMERDIEGATYWHSLIRGNYLQGVLVRYDNELRVYVVVITPQLPTATYERWPRIISLDCPLETRENL